MPEVLERAVTFELDGLRIPAVVSVPGDGRVLWGVLLIPGSFFNDVDGNYLKKDGNPFETRPHVYADLARQLASGGYAVLRYARAGTEIIDEHAASAHLRFLERPNVAAAALRTLKALVPKARLFALAGHSEGSVVASILSSNRSDATVDACICLSGPAYRFFDSMIRQAEARAQHGMVSFGGSSFPLEAYKRSLELVRAGKPVPDDVKSALPPFGVHAMSDVGREYLRELDLFDPGQLLSEVRLPVLIVQGGKDGSVTPDNAQTLFEARDKCSSGTMVACFPELQHFYKPVPPGMPETEAFLLECDSDKAVTEQIAGWLQNHG